MRSPLKIFKKNRLCMKSLQRRQREKDVFQIQPSLSGVKCSNNISVPQVRVNMSGKWTWHNLWSHLSVNLKDKTFPSFYSIEWSGFNLQVNILRWIPRHPHTSVGRHYVDWSYCNNCSWFVPSNKISKNW